jgi:hypothetical protein
MLIGFVLPIGLADEERRLARLANPRRRGGHERWSGGDGWLDANADAHDDRPDGDHDLATSHAAAHFNTRSKNSFCNAGVLVSALTARSAFTIDAMRFSVTS